MSGVYVSQSYVFFSGTYLTVENTPAWCLGISLSHVAFGGTHLTVGNTPCGIEVHHCLMIIIFLPNVLTCRKCYCLVLRYLSVWCVFFFCRIRLLVGNTTAWCLKLWNPHPSPTCCPASICLMNRSFGGSPFPPLCRLLYLRIIEHGIL